MTYTVIGQGSDKIIGWSQTAEQAGERAALYLQSGSDSVTITASKKNFTETVLSDLEI